ncbi:holin (3TMs family) [Rhodovulum imhoffii]|uniref:Holin (3TMs family) n=1 Tax=Rhodovulum imhoffii TaxID=365340 RepID=A0A2T5BQP6_9RHOB|nr:holin family protein [Rhodovulum imhoffii]MBK5934941.1 carboxylesterase [Rhodovulum imhoffii]PTN01407.1 holin (3TMs family) [Rhodovulum imhoffii]
MGMIATLAELMFGSGRNVVRETVEAFRASAEGADDREARMQQAALEQFAAEFAQPRPSRFDRVVDGLNRLPRPALALGTVGLFIAAMVDPDWFGSRMRGLAEVPEPLWWLLGAIISFYFGARHQAKGQEFQRAIARTFVRAQPVQSGPNPALRDWRGGQ